MILLGMYYKLRSVFYRGDQVICPCCGGNFGKFHVVFAGGGQFKTLVCPGCGCRELHRLEWLYLTNKTKFFEGNLKLLHFAPEYILSKKLVSVPNLDYIGIDFNSPLSMANVDITNIPFQDEFFDVVICNHVLEHIIDDRKAMGELFRVLKPDGWAILQVPIDPMRLITFEDSAIILPQDRERFFGQRDHVRYYGLDYKDRLESVGFTVQVDNYAKEFDFTEIRRYGLRTDENIYFCKKTVKKA